uniref:Uncharacterized protein n=1 Tax=Oreochromis niloticus TaxID=8128 RepID=A0A669ERW4_ORENI
LLAALTFELSVLWVCDTVKYGQLCSSNPSNSPRTSDRWGQRHYGARRYSEITFLFLLEGHWMSAGFQGKRKLTEYNDPKKAPTNERINQSGQGGFYKLHVSGNLFLGQRLDHQPHEVCSHVLICSLTVITQYKTLQIM